METSKVYIIHENFQWHDCSFLLIFHIEIVPIYS